jgi:hypothetical protein
MRASERLFTQYFSLAVTLIAAISAMPCSLDAQSRAIPLARSPADAFFSISATNLSQGLLDLSWTQLAKLTASDGTPADWFGAAIAINGDTVVVGQAGYGARSVVYVFEKPAGGWGKMTQVAELTPSDGGPFYGSGQNVAVYGDTIVVGGGGSQNGGAAYVYVKPSSGWTNMTETAQLSSTSYHYYNLGYSVAIRGDTVLIDSYEGTTVLYVKPAAGWKTASTADATLIMPYGTASLAVSGNGTVVLGALDENYLEGSAFVFLKPPGGWMGNVNPSAQLVPSDPTFFFGHSVAIDKAGETVVAGGYNGCEFCYAGAAYVFIKPPGGWVNMQQTAKLRTPDRLSLGASVAIGVRGETIVAGAPFANVGSNQFQGSVYAFHKPRNGWKSTKKFGSVLTIVGGAPGDEFGSAVSISHGNIVAGAPYATIGSNAQQGAAYVFGKQ